MTNISRTIQWQSSIVAALFGRSLVGDQVGGGGNVDEEK